MLRQHRLNSLKQQKTQRSTDEIDRLGWSRYQDIRDDLEPNHFGEFVMIEVESGDYYLGETPGQALERAEEDHPDSVFCLIRVGHAAANKLKRA